jgi:tetratricopeptide (TPR) repeat protein
VTRGTNLQCEIDGVVAELRPRDLSVAGLFVPVVTSLALDREVAIALRSPIGELSVRGQVVQVVTEERATAEGRRAGFGLLFIDLGDDHRAWIGLSLDALLRDEQSRERARRQATADLTAPTPSKPTAPVIDEAAARLAKERTRTLQQLALDLAAVRDKPPWAVLGLASDATPELAKQAFFRLSKQCHPHVYARFDSPEITAAATELFIVYKRALSKLQASDRMQTPSRPAPDVAVPSARPSPLGMTLPPPAISRRPPPPTSSQRPPLVAATPSLSRERCASQRPVARRSADAELAVASGLKHLAASRFEAAITDLERALSLCPESREAALWLLVCRARSAKASGQTEAALRHYRAVLDLDSEHREAREQLRAAGREGRKRAGLVSKWFGSEDD